MAGFENNVLVAKNVNFDESGPKRHLGIIDAAGKLLIGTGLSQPSQEILAGVLTSPLGTLNIGYSSPNITIDVAGGSAPVEQFTLDGAQIIVPSGSPLNINLQGLVVANATHSKALFVTKTASDTAQFQIQLASAIASTNVANVGLAAFKNTDFAVDANGFTSLANPSGTPWTDVTSATQTLAINNGYLTDRGGGVTYTLPSTASIGDKILIVGKLGLATITPNANQQILIGSASGTVGATGTAVANNVGDCITLICITAGASTVWRANAVVGTWTLN